MGHLLLRALSFPLCSSLHSGDPSVSLTLASSPKRGAKGVDENPSPRRALPLLGEVPSAHTGERGRQTRTRSRAEKTVPSADHSFPHRQFLSHGDPSVSLSLDSSPKRGAKGVDENPSVDLTVDSVSLRLGHGAALTCHRHVIHYRAAASLPKRDAKGVDENPSVSLSLPKLPRQGEPR